MIERLRDSPAAHRAAALLLLAILLWIAAPVVTGPWHSWRDGREAVAAEAAILERLNRLDARRAAVAALVAAPDRPFLMATDAAGATAAMTARIDAAAPAGAMRVEGIRPEGGDARPGSPIHVTFGFTATQGALQAFLAEIETRPPFLRVDGLVASPIVEADGSVTLAGTASVSAVPLLRAAP